MRQLISKKDPLNRINSFSYFTSAIREAHAKRKASEPPPVVPVDDAVRAKNTAFMLKVGKRSPYDERWLQSYQQRPGVVA